MISDPSTLRISLLETFNELDEKLRYFCSCLRHDTSPLWISRSEIEIDAGIDMRSKAVRLFQTLWYEDGQDGRETLTCLG